MRDTAHSPSVLGERKASGSPSQTTFKHCRAFVLKRAKNPGQDHAARQRRGMMDIQDWSSLQQGSSDTGLESIQHSIPNTAQTPLLLSCPTDLEGQLTHKDPCTRGWGAPGLYPVSASPLPHPWPPQPQGTESSFTPTSPTPVCTIFRPSSCSSSPFTCSVDREEMVRHASPPHKSPPRNTAKGELRQLPTNSPVQQRDIW